MSRALGGFEQLILLALLRLEDGTYGVAIRREIESRTGKEASTGALYTTPERLDKRGLVACELGEPIRERGGRRLYTLKRKSMMSPSTTVYPFPSDRRTPVSRAAFHDPTVSNSFTWIVSARMKPRSKSEWMVPAA